jgi:hypothetical protein
MPTEADTCRKFVVPKLQAAGWETEPYSIAEQRTITDGRIVPLGKGFVRRPSKQVDRLQFHHIFPKALLRKRNILREADDIANLAFISGRMNRSISDNSPDKYLSKLLERAGQQAFTAQCIPMSPNLWKLENYRDFISERRRLISARLNEYLGVA